MTTHARDPSILTVSKLTRPSEVTMRPQFFKVISGDTFYMGKAGFESEAGRLYVGSVLCAAVANQSRTLGGQRVRVVLFKIGTDGKGWYWLPWNDFYRCTEKVSRGTDTSAPFLM